MSNHPATSFPYGKEDSGLGASFFAKGVEEAMTSVWIYYADHSRHIFLQFCSTESSWQVHDDAKNGEMVSLWCGALLSFWWQILNIFQVLCVKRVTVKTVIHQFLMLSIPVALGTGLILWFCFLFFIMYFADTNSWLQLCASVDSSGWISTLTLNQLTWRIQWALMLPADGRWDLTRCLKG